MIIAICPCSGNITISIDDKPHRVICWGTVDTPSGVPNANVVPLVYDGGRLTDAHNLGKVGELSEELGREGK